MCGIAGIFHPSTPTPVDPNRIQAMIAALAHRGPDGDGIWTAPGVGLGHRRLSIIDLEGSPQPMSDGDLTISYNGEIYNFAELRADLIAGGARFRTAGDTEVLLHGWRAWGPSMLDRLNGMFAFAIHDAGARALFLARDRLGVKPLRLCRAGGRVGGVCLRAEGPARQPAGPARARSVRDRGLHGARLRPRRRLVWSRA
ncbi:asparagine synthetase B family protein [Sphingomonas aerolata]|uniref:asparagine synthetase B family protein n=1 Tax=Sphingomonas aerolata TaxID=185951 RepID=UPI003A5BD449